ncbi:hypothetical protein [Streptomyces griseocarneus]|uniref:hypothetical protein n=1 Tax=Streptomyces griseocarneus TaxID=51201 RepID=UPI00167E28DA|nr:hypothetical protein [Streptomyces griseocarneus]MBZ6477199.1 hypothetical protein [Streptomyces griseocarneus]
MPPVPTEPQRPADLPPPYGPNDSGEPGELGCLRMVIGGPLVLLHLLSAFLVGSAYMVHPDGIWDDNAYTGISAVCFIALHVSGLALLLTLTRSARRTLGPWWLLPPVILILLAVLRVKTV